MTIAIIDSGVDYALPELGGCFGLGCRVKGGHDFVNNDSDPMDDFSHGFFNTTVLSLSPGRRSLSSRTH